jgi:hypothetical protein
MSVTQRPQAWPEPCLRCGRDDRGLYRWVADNPAAASIADEIRLCKLCTQALCGMLTGLRIEGSDGRKDRIKATKAATARRET